MSDLGKIREGSPRGYRDSVFGQRGVVVQLNPETSVDGRTRYVFHPDDITDERVAEFISAMETVEAVYKEVRNNA